MVKVMVDIPADLDKEVAIYKIRNGLVSKRLAIIELLRKVTKKNIISNTNKALPTMNENRDDDALRKA